MYADLSAERSNDIVSFLDCVYTLARQNPGKSSDQVADPMNSKRDLYATSSMGIIDIYQTWRDRI